VVWGYYAEGARLDVSDTVSRMREAGGWRLAGGSRLGPEAED
jgi:hypothetical protein